MDELKKKWKSLKDTYYQRKKIDLQSQRSGSGAKRKVPWRFAESMKFLDGHMQMRQLVL